MNKYFCIIIIFLFLCCISNIYLIENKKINGGNNYYESNKISYEEVENMIKNSGTTLVVVNSVCGCAAANARPGALTSLLNEKKPKVGSFWN